MPGLFSKIAGVMAAKGLQILDAQIMTRPDGIVVDSFHVADPDYHGVPPPDRPLSIAETITRVLKGRSRWTRSSPAADDSDRCDSSRPTANRRKSVSITKRPTASTIIDVFADDRQGLLYVITHAMFQLGLSVHAARISTRLDQVADVFYVTDQHGEETRRPGTSGSHSRPDYRGNRSQVLVDQPEEDSMDTL